MPSAASELATVVVARVFEAPRALVFEAWTSAEHVKRWFCPATYSVPAARVEFRVGGAFEVCMRSPSGEEHWTKGRYTEIVPERRLVIDMHAVAGDDSPLFRAYTIVTFDDEGNGTRIEVTQTYTLYQPFAASMIQGAPAGWRQTLDRLERLIADRPALGVR